MGGNRTVLTRNRGQKHQGDQKNPRVVALELRLQTARILELERGNAHFPGGTGERYSIGASFLYRAYPEIRKDPGS